MKIKYMSISSIKVTILFLLLSLLIPSSLFALQLPRPKEYGDKVYEDNFANYSRNCKAGYSHQCMALGSLYYSGMEVGQDFDKALSLFNLSCGAGNSNGCYMVGRMYKYGQGVPLSITNAIRMFNRSCMLGRQIACDEYLHLRSQYARDKNGLVK